MDLYRRFLATGAALVAGAALVVVAVSAPAAAAPTPPSGPATAASRPPRPVPVVKDPAARQRAAKNAAAAVAKRPAYLHAGAREEFVPGDVVQSRGAQYVPYQRRYAGLPVQGGDAVLVTNPRGEVVYHSVAQKRPIGTLSVTPAVTEATAAATAEKLLQKVTRNVGTRLVVDAISAKPRLAWESTLDGVRDDQPSELAVTVDAITGKVLRSQERMLAGDGTAAWNGPSPVHLDTTRSGTTYSMKDPSITNLDCRDYDTNTTFSGPDDLWGNGDATNRETGCVDSLFAAQTEAKMLSQWLGRNGMNGSGGSFPILVGLNDINAYYRPSDQVLWVGHNVANQWIGSLDVIGHEMGHGVDHHTPGGISGGGTQEFVADTFGASTEWFANESAAYDPPDYLIGERINAFGNGALRNMANPSAVGDPNCYSSAIPTSEVHRAAGPGDHWFYLLAEGTNPTDGQPTSSTCNSSTVGGVGLQNAMNIMYNAMLMKTTASSYLAYRGWTLQAAKNLFPSDCAVFDTVRNAWDAVSVPAQAGEPICADSHPAAVSWSNGRIDTFVRGSDDALWHRWYDGGWSDWESLGGVLTSGPAVASWAPGRLDVFARGTDNALWHRWYDGGWGGWESLGGVLTSAPSAVSWASGRLDVFARGTDNGLYHIWYDGGWGGWEGLGGVLNGGPGVSSWGAGRLDVFVRGTDNNLYHKWYDAGWSDWEWQGGVLTADPTAVSWSYGRIDVFVRGTDYNLYHKWYDAGWSDWEWQGGVLTSGAGVSSWAPGRLDVFVRGTDNAMYHKWYDGGWWDWESLGGVLNLAG